MGKKIEIIEILFEDPGKPGSFNVGLLQLFDGEDKFLEIGSIKAIVIAVINSFISLLLQDHTG